MGQAAGGRAARDGRFVSVRRDGRGASAPAASLQGDLDVFGLPALLQSLAESSASGTLTLREPKGGAVFASSRCAKASSRRSSAAA